MTAVALEHVDKRWGATFALRDVSLAIPSGAFATIVGPSGCGKSTLLQLVAGLDAPSAGTIRFGGEDVTEREPVARGVAMVFQSYALYPHMDVRRNLAFPLEVARLDGRTIDARVREVAARLGIGELLDRRPRELSGGQRQRVALGRALVRRPRICLFDEPLSNLDAHLRAQLRGELKRLHAELGATFVYVTHDHVEAMSLSTVVVVLERGEVRQIGAPRAIWCAPADTFVARFFGSPAMNLVRPSTLGVGDARDDARLVIGVRPEAMRVARGGELRGRVELFEAAGAEGWVTCDVRGESVVARAPEPLAPGGEVALHVDRAALLRFDRETGRAVDR